MRTSRWRVGLLSAAFLMTSAVATAQTAVAQRAPVDTTRPTRVFGTVTDSGGAPIVGAEVGVLDRGDFHAVSSDSGAFELDGLPHGTVVFTARRLGYQAATFSADLHAGHAYRVKFVLTAIAQPLTGVTVQEQGNSGHWLDIFQRRRESQRGTFITRQQIEDSQTHIASDILRRVPGVDVVQTRIGTQLVMRRGAGGRTCVPQLYVHTTPYSGLIDDFTADDIEALEVYVGISEVPSELIRDFRPVCAAVVIWTRAPPPPKPRG